MTPPDTGARRPVVPATEPRRVVVLTDDAGRLDALAGRLRGLSAFGHRVVLVWRDGRPGPELSSFRARVPVRPPSERTVRARLRHAATTAPQRRLAGRGSLAGALAADPVAWAAVTGADAVVPVGEAAERALTALGRRRPPVVPDEELAEWEELGALWRRLRRDADQGPARLTPEQAGRLVDHLALLGDEVPVQHQALLVPVVEALHHSDEHELARRLAASVSPDAEGLDEVERAMRVGLRALVDTSADGAEAPGLRTAADRVVAAADLALEEGDVDRAAAAATLALQLLLHRELHSDGLGSPLVDDPDTFLAAWRSSRVGSLLAAGTPRRPALERVRQAVPHPADGAAPRVVVVPGSYPRFATPVVEALRELAEVRVLDLAARPGLRGVGVRHELVAARLRQALGTETVPDWELVEELERADAVFVDWADRGALTALMHVPDGVPVTLRVHSVDAVSAWVHLVDWSRVADLVVVSDHLAALLRRLLGERLAGTRLHVVPNVLDPARLPTQRPRGTAHLRRLVMVGWARRVKDPLWALEILARLRADDPAWRLTLVGEDFPAAGPRSGQAYARAFRERITAADVRGAVDLVGFTPDVAAHLASAGFVLSTSRRESFALGLVEGAASGAVPVVRDWPVFAPLGGARGLFPAEWVVDDVDAAVARIHAHAQEPAWSAASARAREAVEGRFGPAAAREAFQDVVLGAARGVSRG